MKFFLKKGMTIVEVLVVIAILGVLALVVFPQFSNMRENQILKTAVEEIVASIGSAQSQSLASVNSLEYGIHFQSDKVIIFQGEIFSSGATTNVITNLISPANISNVTFGGVSTSAGDIYFGRLSGTPSKTGTITVSTPSLTKIITISATGAVSFN